MKTAASPNQAGTNRKEKNILLVREKKKYTHTKKLKAMNSTLNIISFNRNN